MSTTKEDKEGPPAFPGFAPPESNYFRMPVDWIDITAGIKNIAELKVVQYVLRHTWGFQEFGIKKHITIDEFVAGRRRRNGSRMDRGTGLSERAVRYGLDDALAHGFLEEERDESDKARIKRSFSLRMQPGAPEDDDPSPPSDELGKARQDLQAEVQSLHPEVQTLQGRGAKFAPRTEIDTLDITSSNTNRPSQPNLIGETPSKFRRGSRSGLREEESGSPTEPQPQQRVGSTRRATRDQPDEPTQALRPSRQAAAGMARISEVLAAAGIAVKRARVEPRTKPATEQFVALAPPPASPAEAPPERIDFVIEDISTKLKDTEHLASNITQARRLWQASGQSVEDFVALLYEIRETVRWKANVGNRMPYFFKCVKVAVGLEPNPHPALPTPLAAPPRRDGATTTAAEASALLPDGYDTARLWRRVLGRLESQMTRPNFETYLRGTASIGISDGHLVVATPSDFVAEWLSTKLARTIRQALMAEAGLAIAVEFVARSESASVSENSAPEALRRPRRARQTPGGVSG